MLQTQITVATDVAPWNKCVGQSGSQVENRETDRCSLVVGWSRQKPRHYAGFFVALHESALGRKRTLHQIHKFKLSAAFLSRF